MNCQHREIRQKIKSMAPKRAVEFVKGFELPEDEERFVIECDVRNRSYIQVAMTYHISTECVKKKRQRAYMKIADGIKQGRAD